MAKAKKPASPVVTDPSKLYGALSLSSRSSIGGKPAIPAPKADVKKE